MRDDHSTMTRYVLSSYPALTTIDADP